ncbi:MAG: hypothetical protein EOO88_27890 [Pedobacter sp.]|nr:MAG: hypothetical protein EOO88_27890 [Pedobacter sp.]
MKVYAFFIIGTIKVGIGSICKFKRRLIGFGIFRYIRPEVNICDARLKGVVGTLIMVPTSVGSIPLGGEPTLIAGHYKSCVGWIKQTRSIVTRFFFINDGIESALEKARQSANGKDIRIQGGCDIIQQFLRAGLIDEGFVHIAPVFLGSGIRLFDGMDKDMYDIEIIASPPSALTTHVRYRFTRR